MNNVEKIGWGFIKWTAGILITFGIFGGLSWFVFYTDMTANFPFIVTARTLLNSNKFPFLGLPSIHVLKSQWPETNLYSIRGTFVSFNRLKDILSLKSSDGKIYNFTTERDTVFVPTDNGNYSLQDNSPGIDKTLINIVKLDGTPTSPNSIFEITWDDTRTLSQIDKDYEANGQKPLNQNSTKEFALIKFN